MTSEFERDSQLTTSELRGMHEGPKPKPKGVAWVQEESAAEADQARSLFLEVSGGPILSEQVDGATVVHTYEINGKVFEETVVDGRRTSFTLVPDTSKEVDQGSS